MATRQAPSQPHKLHGQKSKPQCTLFPVDAYIPRKLASAIRQSQGAPVVVIEGARAVGKTRLMTEEVAPALGAAVFSLADPATRHLAEPNLVDWLETLPRPCIIDEAQLLPELPMALKTVVDRAGSGIQFILTGSASINRTGLGGADPLTRRAVRRTLTPLTQWEIQKNPGNLVDYLFNSDLDLNHRAQWTDTELHQTLSRGGFPTYVQSPGRQNLSTRIWNDIQATLGERSLPETAYDATTALKILTLLLSNPGARFNASRSEQLVDADRRTITRYVDIFERLFLTYHLPNLHRKPGARGMAGSKVHPVDVALAYACLEEHRTDWDASRDVLGQLTESLVSQDLRGNAEVSEENTICMYWASSKSQLEVDTVLVATDGRHVGIECKLGKNIRDTDLKGLRGLDKHLGLHRGFVFYGGDRVQRLGDKYWALPLASLGDPKFFTLSQSRTNITGSTITRKSSMTTTPQELPTALKVFVSYRHDDNDHDDGRPIQFVKDVIAEFEASYGKEAKLFLDRESIKWGEDWQERLNEEIELNTVMVAVVTPRYLRSEACREEAITFWNATQISGTPKQFLPLIWRNLEPVAREFANDAIYKALQKRQYFDVSEALFLERGDREYRKLIHEAAQRLHDALPAANSSETNHHETNSADGPDLLDLTTSISTRLEQLMEGPFVTFTEALVSQSNALFNLPDLTHASAKQTSLAFANVANAAKPSTDELVRITASLRDEWRELNKDTTDMLKLARSVADEETQSDLRTTFEDLSRSMELDGVNEALTKMNAMGAVSKHLRPMSKASIEAINFLRTMQTTVRSWAAAVR